MRFRRADLPGIAIATLAPAALFYLFLASFELWHHHGTPLLGAMAANIAIGGGLLAAFTRFVRNWDAPIIVLLILLAAVAGVIWAQQTGNDGTAIATLLKWVALIMFFVLNAVIGLQVLNNAVLPILDRRDARKRAEQEAAS